MLEGSFHPIRSTRVVRALAACLLCTPCMAGPLVINEVDYDNAATDDAEFVEIKNSSSAFVPLVGIDLVFINGANNTEYLRVDLSPAGGLFPGHYLVVTDIARLALIAPGATALTFVNATNNIQNGAPDGIAIVDTNTHSVVDSLSYEGLMTAAVISGIGTVNLVHGTAFPLADTNDNLFSLSRVPDGTFTGNDSVDWALQTPTPGAMNSCGTPECHSNPGSVSIPTGTTAVFYAAFNAYRPDIYPITFAWRRNGSPLNPLDPRISVVNTAFASTLTITNVGPGDVESAATGYSCKISHACGDTTSLRAALQLQIPCPCDLNGDQVVDDNDFVQFATAYDLLDCADPNMPPNCPSDFNHDGIVDDTDFVIFATAYDALLCP